MFKKIWAVLTGMEKPVTASEWPAQQMERKEALDFSRAQSFSDIESNLKTLKKFVNDRGVTVDASEQWQQIQSVRAMESSLSAETLQNSPAFDTISRMGGLREKVIELVRDEMQEEEEIPTAGL